MIESVNVYRNGMLTHIGVAESERWEEFDMEGMNSWMVWLEDGTACLVDVVPWAPGVMVGTTDDVDL